MRSFILATGAIIAAAAAVPAAAAFQVVPTGYDMPNGGGQASGGSYNYWDLAYSGSGATNVDGAYLSGGSGDLTDGVVANDFWYNVESGAGTGPYVGWYAAGRNQLNPTVAFNFAGSKKIVSMRAHIDNSWVGGVFAPSQVLVDGVSQAFTAPAPGSIGWLDIGGLNLTGNSHTVQFVQSSGWVFVSEVQFNAVPEPASWALMIVGFGMVGGALRTRRRHVVAA
ncbi:MAG TPA: PEPxxWA-CTERM sorting domain-containing protein [Polymorphobacter sp.]|jgi:hypothetical protein|nr:PEPxxWA-CTERM sorting domain-containing protein [Polymorphobacter sp.]